MVLMRRLWIVLAAALLPLVFAGAAGAAPVVVDATAAERTALRADRDAVEGVWGLYQEWDPSPDQARGYRLAVVRNDFGVFSEAKYLGVVICVKEGVTTGEVRLLLSPAASGKRGEFDAVWRAGGREAKGLVRLEEDGEGKPDTVVDMRALTMDGKILLKWLVRI